MKLIPTLLTGLTLLGSVMAPMAKADMASEYITQQNQEQQITEVCRDTWHRSQFDDHRSGTKSTRYYLDPTNNKIYTTEWNGYNGMKCRFVKYELGARSNGTPMNEIFYATDGSPVQWKIEGNELVRYYKFSNGKVSRGVFAQYRF